MLLLIAFSMVFVKSIMSQVFPHLSQIIVNWASFTPCSSERRNDRSCGVQLPLLNFPCSEGRIDRLLWVSLPLLPGWRRRLDRFWCISLPLLARHADYDNCSYDDMLNGRSLPVCPIGMTWLLFSSGPMIKEPDNIFIL